MTRLKRPIGMPDRFKVSVSAAIHPSRAVYALFNHATMVIWISYQSNDCHSFLVKYCLLLDDYGTLHVR